MLHPCSSLGAIGINVGRRVVQDQQGRAATLLADDVWSFVSGNAEALDRAVDYKRDLGYDYFGFKTLEKLSSGSVIICSFHVDPG